MSGTGVNVSGAFSVSVVAVLASGVFGGSTLWTSG